MLKARFRTRFGAVTVIQVYAPTTASTEEIDRFYANMQEATDSTSRQDVLFVIGDLNAKVGETRRHGMV